MAALQGEQVTLRPATDADVETLVAIRSTPEVHHRWRGRDLDAEIRSDLVADDLHLMVILEGEAVVGAIQWHAEEEPDYRHASIDIFLDPSAHGRGLGTDAVRTLARHLVDDHGHHRLVIDPAADNDAAIRCYAKVGFRPVGVMRRYERQGDGTWADGLLMDLMADEIR